jgi:hypothetical protein
MTLWIAHQIEALFKMTGGNDTPSLLKTTMCRVECGAIDITISAGLSNRKETPLGRRNMKDVTKSKPDLGRSATIDGNRIAIDQRYSLSKHLTGGFDEWTY